MLRHSLVGVLAETRGMLRTPFLPPAAARLTPTLVRSLLPSSSVACGGLGPVPGWAVSSRTASQSSRSGCSPSGLLAPACTPPQAQPAPRRAFRTKAQPSVAAQLRSIDTLVYCAKPEELNLLLPVLRAAQSHCDISMVPIKDSRSKQGADFPFHIGVNSATPSRSFYATCGSRQGPAQAAASLAQLICQYRPKRVISVGTCGGIAGRSALKNVVFSTSAMLYEDGKRTADGAMWYDHTQHWASELLVRVSQQLQSDPQHPRADYLIGSFLTGSAVRQDFPEFMKSEGAKLPRSARAVDMEAAAILLVGEQWGVESLVIKAVADMAGVDKADMHHSECMRLVGVAMLDLLQALSVRE